MILPWTPKIVYGLFTDTFPIFNSRKRSYIIIMGLVQGSCLTFVFFPLKNVIFFVTALTIAGFSGAVLDVVIDGLMVV
jgi:MFS family permease